MDKQMLNHMIDTILGNASPHVRGVTGTWRHIETFSDPYWRSYFRKHYFIALEELGIDTNDQT